MSHLKIKVEKIDERIAENYTKIKIGGVAEIIYGDNVIKCKNKFTRYLMSSIVVLVGNIGGCHKYLTSGYVSDNCICAEGMSRGVTARIGTNTTTSTTPDMSDLVDKVDVAPNSITRRAIKEPDYTLYIAEFVFTWNAGTLPDIYEGATAEGDIDGRVGEFGVYLKTDSDNWTSPLSNPSRVSASADGTNSWSNPLGGAGVRLASRIASADGAFDAFEFYGSIDPLTFKWRFQVAIV